ncbi:MAG TPA: YetF domain-containing protein [Chthoniobacterales bacterium]
MSLIDGALGLGLEPKQLSFVQIALRGVIVFIAAIVMVRSGDKRFFARKSAFDVILGFVLASTLARAINGSAPFFPTLGAGFVLVWLHRLLGTIARRWHGLGEVIKGRSDKVISHGQILSDSLRRNHLSERDLIEDLRLNGATKEVADVEEAWIERNGDLSILKKKS